MEGFPRTEAEARYLSSSGLFPDIAVILAVEDTEIVDRLLPPLLEKWRKKRDKREAEKEKQRALAKKQKVSSRFCLFGSENFGLLCLTFLALALVKFIFSEFLH